MPSSEVMYRCSVCQSDVQEHDTVCPKCNADLTEVVHKNEPTEDVVRKLTIVNKLNSGAGWFFWIAGLSLLNSLIVLFNGQWNFVIGLGITQVVDAIAGSGAPELKILGIVINLLVAGAFVGLGLAGRRRFGWAFIGGMVLYALDGLLFLIGPDLLAIGFHVFALFGIYKGYTALRELTSLEEAEKAGVIGNIG